MIQIQINIEWERGVRLLESNLKEKEHERRVEHLQNVIEELQLKLEEVKILLMNLNKDNKNESD